MRRKTTLAQVAVVAGVSKATASNVFKSQKKVSEATRARVMAAAEHLGYRMDGSARSLRGERADVLGVVFVDSTTQLVTNHQSIFWPQLTHSFVGACSERGFVVAYAGQSRAQELINSGISMLIVMGVHPEDSVTDLDIPFGLPVVAMTPVGNVPTTVVGHDAAAIAESVVGHLHDQHSRHIAWLAVEGAKPTLGHWPDALAQACAEVGIDFSYRWVSNGLEDLEDSTSEMLGSGVDAVFALPGSLPNLIEAVRAHGKRIPDDVLLVSQGEGLVEQLLNPPVSNLTLCPAESAEFIARLATDCIRGETITETQTHMPFALNIRQSSVRP